METNRPFAKITSWYVNSSRISRISLTVLFIAIALAFVQLSSWKTVAPMCSLLDDCALRSCDIQRIQLALGQSGLDEFEIEADQIKVPVSQRSTYLKVITELGALPGHLQDEPKLTSNINPFMSRSQQRLMERNEKKRQIREMITRLPFVDQAWFEMDIAESRNAFEPDRQTAVVSIQPTDQNRLSPPEVDTIRQIVGGALAGIRADQIVVTDLNAGRALPNLTDPASQFQQTSSSIEKQPRKDFFESAIRSALESYPGIDVQIHYVSQPRYQPAKGVPDPSSSKPAPVIAKSNPFETVEDTVGTNGTASVDDICPEPEQLASPPPQSDSQFALAQNMRPVSVERVAVSLTVPQEVVEARFGSSRVKTLFGFPLEEAQANFLENNFEKLKSELIEKIRPVLPVSSFDNAESYPISVTLTQRIHEPSTGLAEIQDLVRLHWPTAAVLVIGLLMLLVVTKSKPANNSNSFSEILSIESGIAASGDEPAKTEAEQKLSRLIEQDPDAAAKVIKSWIRKSA